MSGEGYKLNHVQIPVFGFGFVRRHLQNPWFSLKDYYETVPKIHQKSKEITSTRFSNLTTKMAEIGLMERRVLPSRPRQHSNPRLQAQVTDNGVETMLDSTVYRVTHFGMSVPNVFINPAISQIVIEETDLLARIVHAVSEPSESQKWIWGDDEGIRREYSRVIRINSPQ